MTNQASHSDASSAHPSASPGDGQTAEVAQFTGSLADLSVADLIQILQLAGKSAAVVVSHEEGESRLWCAAGEIVDAESGRLRGEAAVHRILSLERGWMAADLRSVPRTRSIFAGTQRLLLEAARRKDESVALRAKLGDPQRCYRLASGLELKQLSLSPLELCLLRSFAEPRSAAETLESSELGDFETLSALVAWIEAGHLVGAGLREARRPPSAARRAQPAPAGTLRPLVASERPRPPTALSSSAVAWAWGAVVALVLTPAGYLLGTHTRPLSEAPAVLPLPMALEPAPPEAPDSYAVLLQVEPPEAEIWLDRETTANGALDTRLPRDGTPHELRVEAPGFLPVQILFVDTPPPVELRLQPDAAHERPALVPTDSSADRGSTTAGATAPPAAEASKPHKRPSAARTSLRRDPPPRQSLRSRPHAALGGLREASARQAASDSAGDPVVHVLD